MEAAPLALDHTTVRHFDRAHRYDSFHPHEHFDAPAESGPLVSELRGDHTETYAMVPSPRITAGSFVPEKRNFTVVRFLGTLFMFAFVGGMSIAAAAALLALMGKAVAVTTLATSLFTWFSPIELFTQVDSAVLAKVFLGPISILISLSFIGMAVSNLVTLAGRVLDPWYKQ